MTRMRKSKRSWVLAEAEKADDDGKGIVILQNPDERKHLDELLLNEFWPAIRKRLEKSGYNYSPDVPKTELELSYALERSLMFMMLNGARAFFRGTLRLTPERWMMESEYFLLLSRENDPQVVFDILSNSRFAGNPPRLMVGKSMLTGSEEDFYQITFNAGNGESWGLYDLSRVHDRVAKVIDANMELYNYAGAGYLSANQLGEFLAIAYKAYEAY